MGAPTTRPVHPICDCVIQVQGRVQLYGNLIEGELWATRNQPTNRERTLFLTNPDLRWTALESGDIHHKSRGLKTVV